MSIEFPGAVEPKVSGGSTISSMHGTIPPCCGMIGSAKKPGRLRRANTPARSCPCARPLSRAHVVDRCRRKDRRRWDLEEPMLTKDTSGGTTSFGIPRSEAFMRGIRSKPWPNSPPGCSRAPSNAGPGHHPGHPGNSPSTSLNHHRMELHASELLPGSGF